jgi:hypothetical protein
MKEDAAEVEVDRLPQIAPAHGVATGTVQRIAAEPSA